MKRLIQFFAPLILVTLVSCATKDATSAAEICVFVGNPPQPEKLDEFHLMNQKTILSSSGFARHLEGKFSLSKTWGVSPEAACAKISNAIVVGPGDDAGRYFVELQGLGHKQAIELVNELCDFYSLQDNLVDLDENSNPQKVTVTIVRRAE